MTIQTNGSKIAANYSTALSAVSDALVAEELRKSYGDREALRGRHALLANE